MVVVVSKSYYLHYNWLRTTSENNSIIFTFSSSLVKKKILRFDVEEKEATYPRSPR